MGLGSSRGNPAAKPNARVGTPKATSSKRAEVVFPGDDVPDSYFQDTLRRFNARFKQIEGKNTGTEVEIYPMSAKDGAAFQNRFGKAVPTGGDWDQNVMYVLHPQGGRYLQMNDFLPEITQEMLQEQLYVLRDIGVQSFIVNKHLYQKIRYT